MHNISSLPKETDYCVPKLNFNKVYEVIIPCREDWKRRPHRIADTINIFTDGLKLNNHVGGGYIQLKWEYTIASDYQTMQEALMHIELIKHNTRDIICIGFVCR